MLKLKKERPQFQPAPNEPNPLEQDVLMFQRSSNPEVRKLGLWLRRWIDQAPARELLLSNAATKWGLNQICKDLSTKQISSFIAIPKVVGQNPLGEKLREILAELSERESKDSSRLKSEEVSEFVWNVYYYALRREYLARRQKNEDRDGREIRRVLVEQGSRGQLISNLSKQITRGRPAPLFFPGESPWRSDEAIAEANLKICEEISELARNTPIATNPNALTAFADGSLNQVLKRAREHVRSRIKTEVRRNEIVTGVPDWKEDQSKAQRHSPFQKRKGERILVETIPDSARPEKFVNKAVLKEFLLKSLKPEDQELVRLCVSEGRKQKDAAALLGISQPQVSKKLRSILSRMRSSASGQIQD